MRLFQCCAIEKKRKNHFVVYRCRRLSFAVIAATTREWAIANRDRNETVASGVSLYCDGRTDRSVGSYYTNSLPGDLWIRLSSIFKKNSSQKRREAKLMSEFPLMRFVWTGIVSRFRHWCWPIASSHTFHLRGRRYFLI